MIFKLKPTQNALHPQFRNSSSSSLLQAEVQLDVTLDFHLATTLHSLVSHS
jgi:hypothetical protein